MRHGAGFCVTLDTPAVEYRPPLNRRYVGQCRDRAASESYRDSLNCLRETV